MSRSEVVNEAPSRNRPTFAATFAPAALLGGLGCLGTAALLAATVPLSWYIITDALGVGAFVAFVVALVALPGYLRGQHATNYSRRVDVSEGDAPRQTVFAQTARVGAVTTWKRLPEEPRPRAEMQLCDAIARGSPITEATAARFGYSRALWEQLRDAWLDAGWVAWRDEDNHRLGLKLTDSGMMWMTMRADGIAPPPQIRPL